MTDPQIDEDHIWVTKYTHKGEDYTRDKDLRKLIGRLHRDAEESWWNDNTGKATAYKRCIRELEDIVGHVDNPCDECGTGGGGLCSDCKDDAMRVER